MKKLYSTLSVDVVKFEAQDVITASGAVTTPETPTYTESAPAASAVPTYVATE